MEKIFRVTYILSGITVRTDDFTDDAMDGNSTESAVKAIRKQFNGVWGFDSNAIEVVSIVPGHYEYRPVPGINLPFFKGDRVFVAD